jgi:hypothetical protein
VFFFYYLWSFFFILIYYLRNVLEYFFIKINHTNIFYKNNFDYLNYFEKLFLSLFYRDNLFYNFYNDLNNKSKIFKYRMNFNPIILFFHFYNKKENYQLSKLNILYKQYTFFKTSSFLSFLLIQKYFFKKYFNLYSSFFYKHYNVNNNIKLVFFFNYIFNKNNKNLIIYNLDVFNDWYKYNFNLNFVRIINKKKNNFNFFYLKDKFFKYNKLFLKNFNQNYNNIYFFKIFTKDLKIKINNEWNNILKKHYKIRFSESSISKYININSIKNYKINYIRKNRIFNKSRYSRNRQLYRTGVYWCLWLNVLIVYGLFFVFYRFTFNFGYFWWGLLFLFYSTIFSRIVKYNFFNIFFLYSEFNNLIIWYGYIFKSLFNSFTIFLNNYIKLDNKKNYFYNSLKDSNIFYSLKLYFYNFYFKFLKNMEIKRFTFFWEGMKEKDESFLRYKTILHWFKQAYKVLIS